MRNVGSWGTESFAFWFEAKAVRTHDNLVLRKDMMERNKNMVDWDSQTAISAITEPEPVHGRTGCRRRRRRR